MGVLHLIHRYFKVVSFQKVFQDCSKRHQVYFNCVLVFTVIWWLFYGVSKVCHACDSLLPYHWYCSQLSLILNDPCYLWLLMVSKIVWIPLIYDCYCSLFSTIVIVISSLWFLLFPAIHDCYCSQPSLVFMVLAL